MNERRIFWWKVGYIVAIAALIVPLHILGLPASKDTPGGTLAKIRRDYGLSEANLGEIDASAETIKLATLGLRGVAVNILWEKANYYKKIEDWTSFGAVLEQISKLQPHFFTVWDFQAHNLTYNTSVEFDDYKDRFDWVIRGINFLKEGKEKNTNDRDPRFTDSRITARLGWFLSNKIGKADEHRQYRRLFKEDDQFFAGDEYFPNRPRDRRDNWLVGADYFDLASKEVAEGAPPPKTPVLFYSQYAMALIYYADALESDSTAGETPHFGQVAEQAWRSAGKAWTEFGHRDLPCIYGNFIRLDALDELVAREAQLEARLRTIMPGEMEKFIADNKLTNEEIQALKTPVEKRSGGDQTIAFQAWEKVAERTSSEHRSEGLTLAGQYEDIELKARDIRSSRDIVNYAFWKARCEAEPTQAALDARRLTYEADYEKQEARPNAAKKKYEQAFAEWRKVLDGSQVLHDDTLMAQDLSEIVDRYRDSLRQLAGDDAKFPEKFILQDALDLNERTNGPSRPPPAEKPTEGEKPKEAQKPKSADKEKQAEKPAAKQATAK